LASSWRQRGCEAAEQGGELGLVPVGEVHGVQRRRRVPEHAPAAHVHATEPGGVVSIQVPINLVAAAGEVVGDAGHGDAGGAVADHAVAERGLLAVPDRDAVDQRRRRGRRGSVRAQRAAHGRHGEAGDGHRRRAGALSRHESAKAELAHVRRAADRAAGALGGHGRDTKAPAAGSRKQQAGEKREDERAAGGSRSRHGRGAWSRVACGWMDSTC
jgi:hypothetical protein